MDWQEGRRLAHVHMLAHTHHVHRHGCFQRCRYKCQEQESSTGRGASSPQPPTCAPRNRSSYFFITASIKQRTWERALSSFLSAECRGGQTNLEDSRSLHFTSTSQLVLNTNNSTPTIISKWLYWDQVQHLRLEKFPAAFFRVFSCGRLAPKL